ncbi:MAG: bifunctional diaminohydroxyphosphoribosylaminopyrimidine deaminase/5-amino-6-(5-phosphoribosylamino)uracil reductase RibD [Sedimentisphaerales bacterium]|nr:bifunctional diaminohydroxyphosphoribosylaminopyrimidine deaminase/5-amino-6-(5-phosphoribosylamino)uracil reductase RibD [Sedimentisphaerales bacterium]
MDKAESQRYMRRALALAAKGAGRVAPNPMVGAVIVKEGQIIGQGYHRRFGQAHAEVNALAHCAKQGHDPRGATMFVTLEPCCHQGKTGPCTEAIAQAGIARVVIATIDDCALVAGKGAQWLRDQGIEVEVGVCQKEARKLNAGFFKLQKQGKPQVILKWAQSINGKLAYPPTSGTNDQPRWITNEKSRRHVHQVRSRCGAVLVGIGTVIADDPLLNVRLDKPAPQPLRVVVDSKLRIPMTSKLVRSAREYPLLICTAEQNLKEQPDLVEALIASRCYVAGLPTDDTGKLSLDAVLLELGKRSITELLVEGGATLHQAFIAQGLADQIMVYIAPAFIAGDNAPKIDLSTLAVEGIILQDVQQQSFDGDVLIEGYIKAL